MKKKLGVFSLAMINVAAVLPLRNFPALAEYGYSVIFYLTLASLFVICFGFIPAQAVREKGPLAMDAYVDFLFVGMMIFILIPVLLHSRGEKKR